MTFPQTLKATRQSLKLTQGELARRLDVSPQTISNWECGRNAPWDAELAGVTARLATLRPARPRVSDRI